MASLSSSTSFTATAVAVAADQPMSLASVSSASSGSSGSSAPRLTFVDWAAHNNLTAWTDSPVLLKTARDYFRFWVTLLSAPKPVVNNLADYEADDTGARRVENLLASGDPRVTKHLHSAIFATRTKTKDAGAVLPSKVALRDAMLLTDPQWCSIPAERQLTYEEYDVLGGGPQNPLSPPSQSSSSADGSALSADVERVCDVLASAPTVCDGYTVVVIQGPCARLLDYLMARQSLVSSMSTRKTKFVIAFISGRYNAEWTPNMGAFLDAFPGSVVLDASRVEITRTTARGADAKCPSRLANLQQLLTAEDHAEWEKCDQKSHQAFFACNVALNLTHADPDKLFVAGQGPLVGKASTASAAPPTDEQKREYQLWRDMYTTARATGDLTPMLRCLNAQYAPGTPEHSQVVGFKYKILNNGPTDAPLADIALWFPLLTAMVGNGAERHVMLTRGRYDRDAKNFFTIVRPIEEVATGAVDAKDAANAKDTTVVNCISMHIDGCDRPDLQDAFHDAICAALWRHVATNGTATVSFPADVPAVLV